MFHKHKGPTDLTRVASRGALLKAEEDPSAASSPRRPTGWGKVKSLKSVGLAAKASVRMTRQRLAHRMPQNVYQKPLPVKADFSQPKFHRTKEELEVIRKALRKNFVFSDLDETELLPLMHAFETCHFQAEEQIITQGSPGDYFYIILRGKVRFLVNGNIVGKAGKGNSFGELALLYTCPRAASVIAHRDCTLFRVDQATFRYILQNETSRSEREKIELLKGVDFFKELSTLDLEKLSKVMTPRVFSPNEVLFRKGELGDAFYVVQEGKIVLSDISVGSATYPDQIVAEGGFFGERSLMTPDPRAANAIAMTYGVAFSIDRQTFETLVGNISCLISRAEDSRKLAEVAIFQKANLSAVQFLAMAQVLNDACHRTGMDFIRKGCLTSPSLYLVRDGCVQVKFRGETRKVSSGEYFGEELFLKGVEFGFPRIRSPLTVTCLEGTRLAELEVARCRGIFDVNVLVSDLECDDVLEEAEDPLPEQFIERDISIEFKAPPRPPLVLEKLKKQKLLGAGTFGQVWLVTDESSQDEQKAYALKVQVKHDLIQEGQVRSVIQERDIMEKVHHPFIVDLLGSFKDKHFIYMVVNLIQGGELFSRIHDLDRDEDGIPEDQARFYAFCLADALAYLHRLGYVFRDLKAENVMLDVHGYPILIDFGFAKKINGKTFTLCGTPGFLPPEIVTTRGHDWSADHWSLGILIYYMIKGKNPFYYDGMDQMSLFQSIVQDDPPEPEGASANAKDIIFKLLEKEPTRRLGSLVRGEQDILEHSWFADLDLDRMRAKEARAPWIPQVLDLLDTSNFDNWDHLEDKMEDDLADLSPRDEALFDDF